VRGGIRRTNGSSAARRAMAAGGRRFSRRWQNELVSGVKRRRIWLGAGRFDLVLFGAPWRPPRAKTALPHLVGAGLVRSSDARPLHAIRDARHCCGEIHSWLEHSGAASGGQFWRKRSPIPLLRWIGFVALRGVL